MDISIDFASGASEETPEHRDISAQLNAARARLAVLPHIKKTIGVVRMWPGQAVAEHENVERLRQAAQLIGVSMVELDRNGRILTSPGETVSRDSVDFVIHLHFETAKLWDAVSVAAMWNPLQYYVDWGFDRYWPNQISHDVFAGTGSAEIDRLLHRERGALVVGNMPRLNHSLATPIYAPAARSSYKAFYCGINWEKVDGKPGRHGGLLRGLDAEGKLDLYGPELVQGIRVWEGYAGYQGSLPFDGKTVIRKIWQAGACLVFSSEAHKASNIMSNRLFEAMAGGAVVVGDDHPFIAQAIGSNYIRIAENLPLKQQVGLITEALAEFDRDPAKALTLARAAQDCLLARFFLSTQLTDIYESVDRFNHQQAEFLAAAPAKVVDIVIQPLALEAGPIKQFIDGLVQAVAGRANLVLLVPLDQVDWYASRFAGGTSIVGWSAPARTIATPADCLHVILPYLQTDKVAFFLGIEKLFPDAFLAACQGFAGIAVGRIGHAIEHVDDKEQKHFDYQSPADRIEKFENAALGAVVFDRAWLQQAPLVRGLSWRGLVRLAESATDRTASSATTAIIIDLKQYERALRGGYSWPKEHAGEPAMINRLNALCEILPSGITMSEAMPPPPVPATGRSEVVLPPAKDLMTAFNELPRPEKLAIALQLYHALPLPGWLSGLISLIRKISGVK